MSSSLVLLVVLLTVSVPLITAQSAGVACLVMNYDFPILHVDAWILVNKVAANNQPIPELPAYGTIPIYAYKTAYAYIQNQQNNVYSVSADTINTALSAIFEDCWDQNGDYYSSSGGLATAYDSGGNLSLEIGIVFTGTGP